MNSFLILITVFFIVLFWGAFFEAPWVPTKKKDFERIAKLTPLHKGILLYDLGSGTGEILFYLSSKYGVNCVGIEISPILYLYSKIKSLFYKNVKIIYGNFYKYDLSKADIVYIFLMPASLNNLKEKFRKELKENSKIIISSWSLKNSNPIKIDRINNERSYFLHNKKSILLV